MTGGLAIATLLFAGGLAPSLPVATSTRIYFSSALDPDDPRPGACAGRDVYAWEPEGRRPERLVESGCVLSLFAGDGDEAYAVQRGEGGLSLVRLSGSRAEALPELERGRALGRAALKRRSLNLGISTPPVIAGFVWRLGRIEAVVDAGEGMAMGVAVSWDGAPSRGVEAVLLGPGLLPASAVVSSDSGTLYFSRLDKGRGTIVALPPDRKVTSWGAPEALPIDWREAAAMAWSIRVPRFLSAAPEGVIVADRTPFVFTEATALSRISEGRDRVMRIPIPDRDVGGIAAVWGGWLVARPLAGTLTWHGDPGRLPPLWRAAAITIQETSAEERE